MRNTLVLKTLALCTCGSLMLGTAWADDKAYKGDKHADLKLQQSSKITGASVLDSNGERIGRIHDLVLFPANGRIEFGLISLSLPEHNGKLTAVPWQLFRMKDANTYMLSTDREKLLSAKMWDASATLDLTEPNFARRTYTHYGLNWDDRMSVGGRVTMPGGIERGVSDPDYRGSIEYYDDADLKFPRPQPDGRSTFPQLNPEEKDTR